MSDLQIVFSVQLYFILNTILVVIFAFMRCSFYVWTPIYDAYLGDIYNIPVYINNSDSGTRFFYMYIFCAYKRLICIALNVLFTFKLLY